MEEALARNTEYARFFYEGLAEPLLGESPRREGLEPLRDGVVEVISLIATAGGLYPPFAMATNVAARKPKIPTVEANQSIHFSARSLFFTCSTVSSASPQRAIAK